jgi:hypothetical protein
MVPVQQLDVQYRWDLCLLNQGIALKGKKCSTPRTCSQKPCLEIPTTSTAEVLFPSADDFIFPFF